MYIYRTSDQSDIGKQTSSTRTIRINSYVFFVNFLRQNKPSCQAMKLINLFRQSQTPDQVDVYTYLYISSKRPIVQGISITNVIGKSWKKIKVKYYMLSTQQLILMIFLFISSVL